MKKTLRGRAAALLGAALLATAVPALTTTPAAAAGPVYLEAGKRLGPGESLADGESRLVMQGDGNLVLYLVGPSGQNAVPLWASGTYNNWGAYAVMQADGNFVIYRQNGSGPGDALWSSGTWNSPGARLQLLDGTVYVTSATIGHRSWQSGTSRYGTPDNVTGLGSGSRTDSKSVWLVMQSDGNLVLYRKRDGQALWATGTWNHPGATAGLPYGTGEFLVSDPRQGRIWSNGVDVRTQARAKLQDDGNFVVYDAAGRALWSTGTWGNW
ncbi:hypothetical protein GCM10020229_80380 [Kitasatospora albolonga]|uniref:hypothetical protein n=1 Tax=Kitasatospora albolonga TaxID=68173 RepID=UPI0031EE7393